MKKILAFFAIGLSGCSFFEPSVLIIENDSEYTIDISENNKRIKNLSLEKDDGDFVMAAPGDLDITVSIDELKFRKEYRITLGYQEKKKFNFNVKE
jgi:hypothetical protein